MLKINEQLSLPDSEIETSAIRAQGAGGQNVNKVSSAIHLRFDIMASSLPADLKQRLLRLRDRRISREGIVIIKAQRSRSQDKNREDALSRLVTLIRGAAVQPKPRTATKPTKASKLRRLSNKTQRSKTKQLRGKVRSNDD